uniref:Plexin cytoplasmic RasGAP domain-containing protein n=1 Tax=Seriola dumerili TaxID=41447 RepID=A0A3B4ULS7_SERDU
KIGSFVPLEEVDRSSEVVGEVTMLNTLNHYEVRVFGGKKKFVILSYSHAETPVLMCGPVVSEMKSPRSLSKVAVHSFVENLFKTIWGTQHSKALHAVKYFFDFLDTQADYMKITDPDVLHIWKTNSLPLRFWVNILKNPQFVFDMEKTPHLDGCLSVIAQAFMDSFSLSETQLGKHAPTNKLLYAKDIPKFKQEVKAYYKQIREQSPITDSEFKDFLQQESKKHENEFNEAAALRELYRFIQRYFTEIKEKLDQNGAPTELTEQLHHIKNLFDGLKSCTWN